MLGQIGGGAGNSRSKFSYSYAPHKVVEALGIEPSSKERNTSSSVFLNAFPRLSYHAQTKLWLSLSNPFAPIARSQSCDQNRTSRAKEF